MPEYPVDLPAERIWDLIKRRAEGDYVNFHVNARKEHRLVRRDGRQALLAEGTLDLEPLVEQDYWILRITGVRDLGAAPDKEDPESSHPELTAEEFETEFIAPGDAEISARVIVQTEDARRAFEDWIRPLRGTADPSPSG